MSLTFPLPASEFMNLLRISSARFWLPDATVQEGNEGGEVFMASRGPRLWQAEFTLTRGHHADRDREEARLAALSAPGASFFAFDPRRVGPRFDHDGALLIGAAPVLSAFTAREISISGLPAGYQIQRGDMIGFSYGASPTRYALHRAVEDVIANTGGVAESIEVVPPPRPGASASTPVQLIRPVCKMVIVPNSTVWGVGSGVITDGASFRATQTLR
jgi:hypothetical protein